MSRSLAITIYAGTAIFFALFFVFPIWHTVEEAFVTADGTVTLAYFAELFRNPLYLEGLVNSFFMGFFTTVLALVIALPLALIGNTWQFRGKEILHALLLVPLVLPPFVGALGVRQFLGQAGVLNTFLIDLGLMEANAPFDWLGEGRLVGIVLMNALHLYPIAYLNISAALANLDPAMEEAAGNMGCHGIRRLFRITLPLIMPGLFAGATIIFIWAFTELGVPLIFDFDRVTSVQIFEGIKDLSGNPFPYALVVVMLVATVFFYLVGKWFFGRDNFSSSGRTILSSAFLATGGGAISTKQSSSSLTPKLLMAEPKNTGESCPWRYFSRSKSGYTSVTISTSSLRVSAAALPRCWSSSGTSRSLKAMMSSSSCLPLWLWKPTSAAAVGWAVCSPGRERRWCAAPGGWSSA